VSATNIQAGQNLTVAAMATIAATGRGKNSRNSVIFDTNALTVAAHVR
jgi:hypothetical protein